MVYDSGVFIARARTSNAFITTGQTSRCAHNHTLVYTSSRTTRSVPTPYGVLSCAPLHWDAHPPPRLWPSRRNQSRQPTNIATHWDRSIDDPDHVSQPCDLQQVLGLSYQAVGPYRTLSIASLALASAVAHFMDVWRPRHTTTPFVVLVTDEPHHRRGPFVPPRPRKPSRDLVP